MAIIRIEIKEKAGERTKCLAGLPSEVLTIEAIASPEDAFKDILPGNDSSEVSAAVWNIESRPNETPKKYCMSVEMLKAKTRRDRTKEQRKYSALRASMMAAMQRSATPELSRIGAECVPNWRSCWLSIIQPKIERVAIPKTATPHQ